MCEILKFTGVEAAETIIGQKAPLLVPPCFAFPLVPQLCCGTVSSEALLRRAFP